MAAERKLSPKYLATLWTLFTTGADASTAAGDPATTTLANYPGSVIDTLRTRWRIAKPEDVAALAAAIRPWQTSLWKTNTVGHFKPWHAPVDPVVVAQELRLKMQPAADAEEFIIHVSANDAGDGPTGDVVVWQDARFEGGGRAPLALKDLRRQSEYLIARRQEIMADTARYLEACAAAQGIGESVDVAALAVDHKLDPQALAGWLNYLGTVPQGGRGGRESHDGSSHDHRRLQLRARLEHQRSSQPGREFVRSRSPHPGPVAAARRHRSSDAELASCGWLAQPRGRNRRNQRACRAGTHGLRERHYLGAPRAARLVPSSAGQRNERSTEGTDRRPFENINIRPGDLVSLAIGPRDANHACDLTEIDLTVKATDGSGRTWQLAPDISADVLAGNPHADRFGNKEVWHFYTEPTSGEVLFAPLIPADSALARWRDAKEPSEKRQLTGEVAKLLADPRPGPGDEPDKLLYRQATSLVGPVMGMIASAVRTQPADSLAVPAQPAADNAPRWGIDPALFGKKPDGSSAEPNYLVVQAPSILTVRVPAELVAGSDFVVTATLDPALGAEGSVQPTVSTVAPDSLSVIIPGKPIVTGEGSQARARVTAALADVRRLFPPAASCYPRIVPVDEAGNAATLASR